MALFLLQVKSTLRFASMATTSAFVYTVSLVDSDAEFLLLLARLQDGRPVVLCGFKHLQLAGILRHPNISPPSRSSLNIAC